MLGPYPISEEFDLDSISSEFDIINLHDPEEKAAELLAEGSLCAFYRSNGVRALETVFDADQQLNVSKS